MSYPDAALRATGVRHIYLIRLVGCSGLADSYLMTQQIVVEYIMVYQIPETGLVECGLEKSILPVSRFV